MMGAPAAAAAGGAGAGGGSGEDWAGEAAAAESLAGVAAAAAMARECGPQMVADFVLGSFEKLRASGAVDLPKTLALL